MRASGHRPASRMKSMTWLAAGAVGGALTLGMAGAARSEPHPLSPQALNGQILDRVALPGGEFQAITLKDRPGLWFVSSNGRFLIRGSLYDLWGKAEITSLAAVRHAAATVDLDGLEHVWPSMAPITVGSGPRRIVAFVSPTCPHCAQLMAQLQGQGDRYRFELMLVPTDQPSGGIIRMLSCAADRDAARAALLDHDFITPLAQDPGCDVAPITKRLIAQQIIGIQSVPTLIRDDGALHRGMPQDLSAWLAGGRVR